MGNFNIKIDRPKLSNEEIASKQNFEKVLSDYTQSVLPLYKKPWFWGSTGLASLGFITVFTLNSLQNKTEVNQNNQITQGLPPDTECIKPPIKSENVPFTSFNINSEKEEKIVLKSGTIVTIPEGSIQALNKNEDVEIKIREFKTKTDAFIAGIPMDYDKNMAFESAGMIEIRGVQNDKEVKISPSKPIEIELACTQNPESFDFWFLNEKEKNWQTYPSNKQQEKEIEQKAQFNSSKVNSKNTSTEKELNSNIVEIKKEIVAIDKKIENLNQPEKEEFKIPKEQHQKFDLDFNKKEYPELAKFENLVFEVVAKSGYDKTFTQKKWSEVELLKEKEDYVMKFSNENDVFKIKVRPVLTGTELQKAEKEFDKAILDYKDIKVKLEQEKNIFLKKQLENEKRLNELFEQEVNNQLNQSSSSSIERKNYLNEKSLKEMNTIASNSYTLTFQTTKWGIFNSDKPILYPEPLENEIAFVYENSNSVQFKQLFVFNIEKNNRYVYGTFIHPIANFGLHKKSDIVIIGIDYDGNVGYKELKNRANEELFSKIVFIKKEKSENTADLLKKLLNETTEVS
jgi:hypothetical protein